MDSLQIIKHRVQKKLVLSFLKLDVNQFKTILECNSHCESIAFDTCKFENFDNEFDVDFGIEFSVKCITIEGQTKDLKINQIKYLLKALSSNKYILKTLEKIQIEKEAINYDELNDFMRNRLKFKKAVISRIV